MLEKDKLSIHVVEYPINFLSYTALTKLRSRRQNGEVAADCVEPAKHRVDEWTKQYSRHYWARRLPVPRAELCLHSLNADLPGIYGATCSARMKAIEYDG